MLQDKVLKVGDQILAVNGQPVSDMTSSNVADLIQANEEVELTISSHTIVPLPHSPLSAVRSSNLAPADQCKHFYANVPGCMRRQVIF